MYAADALSCAAMADDIRNTDQTKLDVEAKVAAVIKYVPIIDKNERNKTISDPTMQILKNYIPHGWPETTKSSKNEVKPNFNHRTELVLFHDIEQKGEQTVISAQLRTNILEKIHAGHQGQEKCKRRTRGSAFGPGINKNIEGIVQECYMCMTDRSNRSNL